ncbi:hypothetical protein AB0I81_20365 [Nonomuraea sp. NPDC050404]|uniref:hypothetical protein n=1 Tax=Nonomuraea sp. NPDC050404 TaxID=3155783 RepID=UPI0033DB99F5
MAITTPENTGTENIPADTDAAINNADAAVPAPAAGPLTAPDRHGTAAPNTGPTVGTDTRTEAVWAALNAEPGATATAIGAAAGLSRMVTGKILNQLDAEGRARREPGTNDGQTRGRAADRWYPITTDTTAPDTSASDTPDAETPGTAPAAPDADAPDADTSQGDPVEASEEETLPADSGTAAPTPVAAPSDEEEAHDQPEELTGDEASDEGPDQTHVPVPGADPSEPVSDPVSESVSGPVVDDPAWARVRAELAELTDLLGGVALAKDDGNDVMALGCLEMAMARIASVHRDARAVLTGIDAAPARAVPGARPGGASGGVGSGVRPGALRDRVYAHLIEYPGKDFTPYEIGKVLDASSGAVANALDRLVNLGHAELTCERPRRFALTPTETATATRADARDTAVGEPGNTVPDGYDD